MFAVTKYSVYLLNQGIMNDRVANYFHLLPCRDCSDCLLSAERTITQVSQEFCHKQALNAFKREQYNSFLHQNEEGVVVLLIQTPLKR